MSVVPPPEHIFALAETSRRTAVLLHRLGEARDVVAKDAALLYALDSLRALASVLPGRTNPVVRAGWSAEVLLAYEELCGRCRQLFSLPGWEVFGSGGPVVIGSGGVVERDQDGNVIRELHNPLAEAPASAELLAAIEREAGFLLGAVLPLVAGAPPNDALERMRLAIQAKPNGRNPKPDDLIRRVGIAEAEGRKALRQLEELGEYEGFARKKPRRNR
jgi:hypothetical protein